jgi:hypothetical protein
MHLVLALALALQPVAVPDEPAQNGAPADVVPEPEPPPEPDPEPAMDGATLFRVGRYREAAAAFAREYETNPDPALLFGRAAAFKRSGDCLSALDAFEAFIAVGPPAPDVEEAERQIEECEAIVEATARAANERTQKAPPAASLDPETSPPRDRAPAPARWSRDPIGGTLVGTGAAVLLAGAGLYGAAFGVAGRAQPDAQSEHESRRRQVRSLAGTGIPMMAVGAALLVGGIARWTVLARREKRARTASVDAAGLIVKF